MYTQLVESYNVDEVFLSVGKKNSEIVGKKKKKVTRWIQVQKKGSVKEMATKVAESLKSFSGLNLPR